MTIEEAIYDVLEIKQAIEDDSDLDPTWILNKLNMYRAIFIEQDYALTGHINSGWVQRHPVFTFEKVTSGDDPNITYSSLTMAKYKLPQIVKLPDDEGIVSVMGSGRTRQLSRTDWNTLMMRVEIDEDIHPDHGWWCMVGDELYVYPYIIQGQAHIVASNPMDVPVIEDGESRVMTFADNYPLDAGTAQKCVLEILSKDLAISDRQISDIVNDSQVELKIVKNAGTKQVPGAAG